MAHYAFLNEDNIVTEVIVGRNEDEIIDGIFDWEKYYEELKGQTCKRTSYNNNIRKNFASIGFKYDENKDAFIPPKPYNSWILNEDTCLWQSPTSRPSDENLYIWNEENLNWEITVLLDNEIIDQPIK